MQSLSELPCFNLSNEEILKETGAWIYHASSNLFDSKDLFRDVIENPVKANEEVGKMVNLLNQDITTYIHYKIS